MLPALSDFDPATLGDTFASAGFKPGHARTLLRSYFDRNADINLENLSLGKALTAHLHEKFRIARTRIIKEHASADGTIKLLIGLDENATVESVLMPAFRPDRAAACISSQVGCAMGCDFCASTRGGLTRNLSSGEIVEQFLHLRGKAHSLGRRLTSLVFMGMGEPLHNLANVAAAIGRIADPQMGNLGWRHITVSTVGVVPGIDQLAEMDIPVYLALSLHAPDDATRSRLVPANRRWSVADVMAAARRYQAKTGRILNIEYCLLRDVNDSDEQARLLAGLMRGFAAHVNLIPYNWIGAGLSGTVYRTPEPPRIDRFLNILRDAGVVTHIRVARGDDVNAACGQLRELVALNDCP
jgi:23S rRNA (adenine2503-C2)-methyltransferase